MGCFGVPSGACAQNRSKTLPDAQIESNVLRALASAPELSTQNIQSSTVYGTVTLTGNVHDEDMRTTAENLVARAQGVKKVVDELPWGYAAGRRRTKVRPTSRSERAAPNGQPDGSQNNQTVLSLMEPTRPRGAEWRAGTVQLASRSRR